MSESKFFCFGKNDFCDDAYKDKACEKCRHMDGHGGEMRTVPESPRLNREAWKPCEFCGEDRKDFGLDCGGDGIGIVIGNSLATIGSDSWGFLVNFCPKCGRPITEEAWEMLEQRLEV